MVKTILRRATLLLFIGLLLSCSGRREARRQALDEIKVMPGETMAVHPVVNQIRDFRDQLEEVQAVLNEEDPAMALREADASLRQLQGDMAEFEKTLESAGVQMRRLRRLFEQHQRELEARP